MSSIMSSDPETSRSRRATKAALSKMYDVTNKIADRNIGKNRGLAAGTAASLLELGLDRMNQTNSDDQFAYTEEELKSMKDLALSAEEELQNKEDNKQGHFVDNFLEKVLKHAIPADEQILFEQKLKDPDRNKRPRLSFRILASNFKKLSSKMGGFFEIQYGLIHVITWKKPTKTLSFLVLYTSVCLWPHLVLALPLLFLLFGIMIPGYNHRHPMPTPELIKVKKRGQSLLDFFNLSLDSSIFMDLIGDEYREDRFDSDTFSSKSSDTNISSTVFTQQPSSASSVSEDSGENGENLEKKKRAKYAKSQVSLMINMRDLQNLTTDLLNGFQAAETFWFETAGFKDERLSTFMFYGVIVASSIILFLGAYIPWRLIFIQSGWAGIILCHPNSKKYLMTLKKNKQIAQIKAQAQKAKTEEPVKEETEETDKDTGVVKRFERNDIIVDDSPELRTVEVFELQVKSLTKNTWSFYLYSTKVFSHKDHLRIAGKKPTGVNHLSKVAPPPDWKFDVGYENNWIIDNDPEKFLKARAYDVSKFSFEDVEKDGWFYDAHDVNDSYDMTYQFRRRRLIRVCYRYARPAKKPKGY